MKNQSTDRKKKPKHNYLTERTEKVFFCKDEYRVQRGKKTMINILLAKIMKAKVNQQA
jgi:hypothetical protein